MKTPPSMLHKTDEDAEAQELADEAVERGTTLIRSHLSNHIAENPDSSFVTWIATLHPENADVTIDQRFLIPGNPWWTVYEEACCKHNDFPTTTAVPVAGDEEQQEGVSTMTNNTSSSSRQKQPHFCYRCSPIDLIVGFSLALSAFLAVAMMEFFATVLYTLGAVFFHMATALAPPNLCTGFFYSLFMLLYYVFALIDSILLLTSIFVVELLATITLILSMCFGGVNMAFSWHQYIRRTCHLARWAFRSPFTSPPRQLFCQRATDNDGEEEQATMIPTVLVPRAPQPTVVVLDEKYIVVTGSSSKSMGS